MRWSSTWAPLRLQAATYLSNTAFAEPRPYPGALHVAVAQGYNPLNHRGWLHGVSPEEVAHGMIFAVAAAMRSEAGNTTPMNAWKRCLLSTPFTFQLLGTPEQRVWCALQQREILCNAANRTSCFQRCHAVARVLQLLAETTSAAVTSQMVYDACQKNFTTLPHLAGTLSFYSIINTVLQKMLGVSDIHAVLQ